MVDWYQTYASMKGKKSEAQQTDIFIKRRCSGDRAFSLIMKAKEKLSRVGISYFFFNGISFSLIGILEIFDFLRR